MSLKSEIKKAITQNSKRYQAVKVWNIEFEESNDYAENAAESLIEDFEKDVLTEFLDFLLKEGYCDTDVYNEPPTAIDQYLIFNKQK